MTEPGMCPAVDLHPTITYMFRRCRSEAGHAGAHDWACEWIDGEPLLRAQQAEQKSLDRD